MATRETAQDAPVGRLLGVLFFFVAFLIAVVVIWALFGDQVLVGSLLSGLVLGLLFGALINRLVDAST
jgi:multisubunit Na+/H+ antiporter MnhE subunit